ncbi:MAG: PLP-dependent aminotransferase family protein [Firmicutes bacterium]|nr:PLP-dependent aminotransferase family protein [Bacillota bacterium]MDY2807895.1 PLP-dependent aminotransferase family protein [Oscillospiraceae bacterium]
MQTYTLDRSGASPLYEQLYRALKADILSGALPGGSRLPSGRALAEHLGLSRVTVETAYAQLLAEGYLTSRPRAGYFVEQLTPQELPPRVSEPEAQPPEPETAQSRSAQLFPFSVWARLMRGVLLDRRQELLRPAPDAGLPALRQAVAAELYRQRGVHVSPEQVYIGAGAEYFYNLLIQFFGHGRVYALENPGHRKIARVYQANQVAVRPIGMDADGVIPELLEQSGAEVLHISPSHHYPTGTVTPITRRQALMRWLTAQPGRYLIEDDYDSEFRFSGLPIPTIQSMDRSGRVIYMNTFSRTISPSLRISYMILPRTLLPQWQAAMGFYSCTVPSFEQMTLTRFLAEGYFEKHLSRMKKHYRAVRAQLFSVLHTPQAVRQCAVHDTDAGLHLVLELKNAPEPEALRALLRQSGLPDALLSDFFLDAPSPQAQKSIVLGYADAEPAQLEAALTALFTRLEAREAPV